MGIIAEKWGIDERVQLTVHRAAGLRRLAGLIGRAELSPSTALRIPGCRSVHSCFMHLALDVLFVDAAGYVIEVRRLATWRFASCASADQVFELRAGDASRLGIVPGSRLTLRQSQEGSR